MKIMPPLITALCSLLLISSFASAASLPSTSDLHRVCPNYCSCDIVGRHIIADCSYASIDTFPSILPRNITQLFLNGNPLGHISRDDLQNSHLEYLEDFQCADCQLTELQVDTFLAFKRLKYIDLSNNDLSDISTDIFEGSTDLRLVNVKSNKRLDCAATVAVFKKKLTQVKLKCVDDIPGTTSASSALVRKRREEEVALPTSEEEPIAIRDEPIAAKGDPIAVGDSTVSYVDASTPINDSPLHIEVTEPDSGFGVGTIIFIVILGIIICIVCFKFVFLRLRKRFCRGNMRSEEQPLDSD